MPHFRMFMRVAPLLPATIFLFGSFGFAQTACPAVSVVPNPNYTYLVASAPGATDGIWRWVVNGKPQDPIAGAQKLLLHADAARFSAATTTAPLSVFERFGHSSMRLQLLRMQALSRFFNVAQLPERPSTT